jgi:hypothetical protein
MHASLRSTLSVLLLFFGLVAAFSATAAPPDKGGLNVPVVGTGPAGSFAGNFQIQQFAETGDGGVAAIGTLTGVVKATDGTTVGSIVKNVALPVTMPSAVRSIGIQQVASCEILHLDLGPIFLDLLGLQISLSRVVLDITAVPGAGNLLGNLLCAIAGLLDPGPPSPLSQLVNLLNRLLAILQ